MNKHSIKDIQKFLVQNAIYWDGYITTPHFYMLIGDMVLVEENREITAYLDVEPNKFLVYEAKYSRNGREMETDLELVKDLSSLWVVSAYNDHSQKYDDGLNF